MADPAVIKYSKCYIYKPHLNFVKDGPLKKLLAETAVVRPWFYYSLGTPVRGYYVSLLRRTIDTRVYTRFS